MIFVCVERPRGYLKTTSGTMLVFMDTTPSVMMLIGGILSTIATSSVIVTISSSRKLRSKSYLQMVLFSAISDFLSAPFKSLGVLKDETIACSLQGSITCLFDLASVFWILMISFSIYSAVIYSKKIIISPLMHLFCWGFPLLATYSVYSTNRFGTIPRGIYDFCFIGNTQYSPSWGALFWTFASFHGGVIFSLLAMAYVAIRKNIAVRHTKQRLQSVMEKVASDSTGHEHYYILVIFICWPLRAVHRMTTIFVTINSPVYELYNNITLLIAGLQGFFLSIIFYTHFTAFKKKASQVKHSLQVALISTRKNGFSSLQSGRVNPTLLVSTKRERVGVESAQSLRPTVRLRLPSKRVIDKEVLELMATTHNSQSLSVHDTPAISVTVTVPMARRTTVDLHTRPGTSDEAVKDAPIGNNSSAVAGRVIYAWDEHKSIQSVDHESDTDESHSKRSPSSHAYPDSVPAQNEEELKMDAVRPVESLR